MAAPNDYPNNNEYGFVNPRHHTPRVKKVDWKNPANNELLLLFCMEKQIIPREYPLIAAAFEGKPTPKAIQEQLAKLRRKQMDLLQKYGLVGPSKTEFAPALDDNATTATETPGPSEADVSMAETETPPTFTLPNPAARIMAQKKQEQREIIAGGITNSTGPSPGKKRPRSTLNVNDDDNDESPSSFASKPSKKPRLRLRKPKQPETSNQELSNPEPIGPPNFDWMGPELAKLAEESVAAGPRPQETRMEDVRSGGFTAVNRPATKETGAAVESAGEAAEGGAAVESDPELLAAAKNFAEFSRAAWEHAAKHPK